MFSFPALFRSLFFISIASTSCHLQTIRANVNLPRVYSCARGAMHGSDPEGEWVAQMGGVGGHLGYLHKAMWLSCSHWFIISLQNLGVAQRMRTTINCRTVSKGSTANEKNHRLLLRQQGTSRDYVEICLDHVSKTVLSLITPEMYPVFIMIWYSPLDSLQIVKNPSLRT